MDEIWARWDFFNMCFLNILETQYMMGKIPKAEKVKLAKKNWSIVPMKKARKLLPKTRAYPNKMTDVSCLMDKMTQIPLHPAWHKG